MALFEKSGSNLSRAGAIISKIGKKPEPTPAEPQEPAQPTPPVEGGQQVQEPTVPETPPVVDDNTPPAEPVSPTAVDPEQPAEPQEGAVTPQGEPVSPQGEPTVPEPAEPQTPPQSAEVTDDLVFNKLSEMLGKEIKSVDDLKPKDPELDPQLAQLKKWSEETGLPISSWPEYARDYSKMGDMDVAREILSQQYPNFTQEELNYSLQQFVYNEDADEEADKMRKSIALKKFAQEGRQKLEKNKLTLQESAAKPTLTKEQQEALDYYSKAQEQTVQAQKAQQAYEQGIKQASNTLNALDLKLSDELTIKYNMPVEAKNSLPKAVKEMPSWYNKDGSLNHENVVKDVAKITNFEAIMNMVYNQGVAVGKEGKINPKGATPITDPGVAPVQPQGEPKGNINEVVSSITGNRPRLRFGKPKE